MLPVHFLGYTTSLSTHPNVSESRFAISHAFRSSFCLWYSTRPGVATLLAGWEMILLSTTARANA